MIKAIPVEKTEFEKYQKDDNFVIWIEKPIIEKEIGAVLVHVKPKLVRMERMVGKSFEGSLMQYESEELGTFRTILGTKRRRKSIIEISKEIQEDGDKIISLSTDTYSGGRRDFYGDISYERPEKNSFFIKDDDFGNHSVRFLKNTLSFYLVIDIKRPTREMSFHDAEGLAQKYFRR